MDRDRSRPLELIFEAVLKGQKDVVRALRADPQACRTQAPRDVFVDSIPHMLYVGDTPLHLAAAALLPDVAKVLLGSGSDPNAANRRGATPLHYVCDARPSAGTWNPAAQVAIIEFLVTSGALLEHCDRGGATPLHRAVRARSPRAVSKLLDLGARADARLRPRGSTPLHLAAQSTGASGTAGTLDLQLEIIDLLLRHGADVAAVDKANRTPFDWASVDRVSEALSVRRSELKRQRRPTRQR